MRFLADENFSAKLSAFLRSDGHDVRPVIKGTADPDIAAQAKAESRILLTHDTDFSNTDEYPATAHAGIILIRANPLFVDKIRTVLTNLLSSAPEPNFKGRRFLVFEETFVELPEGERISFSSG